MVGFQRTHTFVASQAAKKANILASLTSCVAQKMAYKDILGIWLHITRLGVAGFRFRV